MSMEKLKDALREFYFNFTPESKYDDLGKELDRIVVLGYEITNSMVQEHLIKAFAHDRPSISLSDEMYKGYAYYSKPTRKIVVLKEAFKQYVFSRFKQGSSPLVVETKLIARLTFSILHEVGHFHYYSDGLYDIDPANDLGMYLRQRTADLNVEALKKNEEVKDFLLGEARMSVISEKYADNYAEKVLKEQFPAVYESIQGMGVLAVRKREYIHYAKNKIKIYVAILFLNVLSDSEKRKPRMHFYKFINPSEFA